MCGMCGITSLPGAIPRSPCRPQRCRIFPCPTCPSVASAASGCPLPVSFHCVVFVAMPQNTRNRLEFHFRQLRILFQRAYQKCSSATPPSRCLPSFWCGWSPYGRRQNPGVDLGCGSWLWISDNHCHSTWTLILTPILKHKATILVGLLPRHA